MHVEYKNSGKVLNDNINIYNSNNTNSVSFNNKKELFDSFKAVEKKKIDDLSTKNFRFSDNSKKINFLLKKSFK